MVSGDSRSVGRDPLWRPVAPRESYGSPAAPPRKGRPLRRALRRPEARPPVGCGPFPASRGPREPGGHSRHRASGQGLGAGVGPEIGAGPPVRPPSGPGPDESGARLWRRTGRALRGKSREKGRGSRCTRGPWDAVPRPSVPRG